MRLNELAKNDIHHLLGALCMPVPTSNTVRVLQFDEPVVAPPPKQTRVEQEDRGDRVEPVSNEETPTHHNAQRRRRRV